MSYIHAWANVFNVILLLIDITTRQVDGCEMMEKT